MSDLRYRRDLHKIIDLSLPGAEIGVAEGLFSRDILSWGIAKLYMVDNWATIPGAYGDGASDQEWHEANFENALKLVSPFGAKRYSILRGLSVDMAEHVSDAHLGFVYLDACHTYECVTADLNAWYPKLVEGGIMAGHDYAMEHYGVKEAVHDFIKGKNIKLHILPEDAKKDTGFWFYKY